MAKHTVDFDDYEEREGSGYDGEEPKKGLYDGRLVSVRDHESAAGNEGLEWVFEITEEPYAGWRGWVYSNMDSAKWKTQQIVKALQGGAEKKIVIDTDDNGKKTVAKSKPVRLRVVNEKYEGETKGRIRTIMAAAEAKAKAANSKAADADEDDDEDDEDPF